MIFYKNKENRFIRVNEAFAKASGMPKEELEKVIKEKVEPLIEDLTQKYLGVTISELNKDITDKIEKNPLLSFDINTSLSFKDAKNFYTATD